jgi:outer membrane immunogenic protein
MNQGRPRSTAHRPPSGEAKMRKPSLAAAALFACSLGAATQVVAADYPVLRGSQFDDAPPPSSEYFNERFSWTGFYVGGGAGMSNTTFESGTGLQTLARQAYRNTTLGREYDIGSFVSDLPEKRDSGAQYFGFAGYNWAFGDAVIGIEADYTRSGHDYRINDFIARRLTTSDGALNDISLTTTQAARLQDYASARLRFGWGYGKIMPYVTLGGAVGRFDTTSTIDATWRVTRTNPVTGAIENFTANGYNPFLRVGNSKKNVYGYGLTFGGGVDWALTENLFLRGEYQVVRFADVEGTTTTINTGRVAAALKF